MLTGDARTAMQNYTPAIIDLAGRRRAVDWRLPRRYAGHPAGQWRRTAAFQRNATSAAWNGYQLLAHRRRARRRAARDCASASTAAIYSGRRCRPMRQAWRWSTRPRSGPIRRPQGPQGLPRRRAHDRCRQRRAARLRAVLRRPGQVRRRLCAFVTVDDAAPKAVEAEGKQICVEGLEHGEHYNITFRAGLPAAIGEVAGSARSRSTIYIQDRAPSARFTGDSFVLPATARRGIPVVTVNMDVRRHEALPHRRPLAGAASVRLPVPAPARRLRHRARSPTRWARRSGRASSTSPTTSTRKSPPASRSTRRCPTASPASMC